MAEKRYYWLRLYDDFFTSKRIKKLRQMAGGDTYTIIYLKMQLLAMKNGGVLHWTGLEDNFADELALDLDEEPMNVGVTLSYLLSCGLAETDDNVDYFIPYSVSNTGSENASAQRVREYRERQKSLHCNADVTDKKRNGNAEKEIDTRVRDNSKSIEERETRRKYGLYKNVLLSDSDYAKLVEEFPYDYDDRIARLSEYIASTGKRYKNHLATIRAWARKGAANDNKTEDALEQWLASKEFDDDKG